MADKEHVFTIKERPIVTTTIQGGSYDPYRIVFDNDDIQVSKSDYNASRIILKNVYTEPIDASEYFDDLWVALKGDGVCTITVNIEALGVRNYIGSKVTLYAGQGTTSANCCQCRGVLVAGNVNVSLEFYPETKIIAFVTGTLPE